MRKRLAILLACFGLMGGVLAGCAQPGEDYDEDDIEVVVEEEDEGEVEYEDD